MENEVFADKSGLGGMMSSIRIFKLSHTHEIVSFDIEIDFSKTASLMMDCYPVTREGNSVKTDIIAMSLFWYGHPGKEAGFEEHLKFFLEVLSRKVSDYIINKDERQKFIYQYLNEEEGYYPCFGDAITITNVCCDNDFITDGLSLKEKQ